MSKKDRNEDKGDEWGKSEDFAKQEDLTKRDSLTAPVDTRFDTPPTTPNDRVAAVAARHREGPTALERLKELQGSSDPLRHQQACDVLLDHIGDDELRDAFNTIPRHL